MPLDGDVLQDLSAYKRKHSSVSPELKKTRWLNVLEMIKNYPSDTREDDWHSRYPFELTPEPFVAAQIFGLDKVQRALTASKSSKSPGTKTATQSISSF